MSSKYGAASQANPALKRPAPAGALPAGAFSASWGGRTEPPVFPFATGSIPVLAAGPPEQDDPDAFAAEISGPRAGDAAGRADAGAWRWRRSEAATGARRCRRRQRRKTTPLRRLKRTVVATTADNEAFGWQVATEVHRRGLDQASRKACLGDGSQAIWALFALHLQGSEFLGKGGAETILQVRTAYLSEDGRAGRYCARPRRYASAAGVGHLRRVAAPQ